MEETALSHEEIIRRERTIRRIGVLKRAAEWTSGRLDLSNIDLTELPPLPADLTYLNCDYNKLTSLSGLPAGLTELNCSDNQLIALSGLPSGLTRLVCSSNPFASLPIFPESLLELSITNIGLTVLPPLPSNLKYLCCTHNKLKYLSGLPDSLIILDCGSNKLVTLPDLPTSLIRLDCGANKLLSLPDLPASLRALDCRGNLLITLPKESIHLTSLNCIVNNIDVEFDIPVPERYRERPGVLSRSMRWIDIGYIYGNETILQYLTLVYANEKIQSKDRNSKRCRAIMEELMMFAWSPARLNYLIASYSSNQWNHETRTYEPLTSITMNEIL
jgi:Leucine-rich repeat (LRR) protein